MKGHDFQEPHSGSTKIKCYKKWHLLDTQHVKYLKPTMRMYCVYDLGEFCYPGDRMP